MTSLEWQSDATDTPAQHHAPAHPHVPTARAADPWFPVAVGLAGVVVGYLIGS